jgi:hypothetical protein
MSAWVPFPVLIITHGCVQAIVEIDAGQHHALGLSKDGKVACLNTLLACLNTLLACLNTSGSPLTLGLMSVHQRILVDKVNVGLWSRARRLWKTG